MTTQASLLVQVGCDVLIGQSAFRLLAYPHAIDNAHAGTSGRSHWATTSTNSSTTTRFFISQFFYYTMIAAVVSYTCRTAFTWRVCRDSSFKEDAAGLVSHRDNQGHEHCNHERPGTHFLTANQRLSMLEKEVGEQFWLPSIRDLQVIPHLKSARISIKTQPTRFNMPLCL